MISPLLPRLWLSLGMLTLSPLFSCASSDPDPKSPANAEATESLDETVSLRANNDLDHRDLLAAARRELRLFKKHRRRADLEDAAFSIKSQLRGEGYHFAQVEFETTPPTGKIESAVLIVDEGPLVSCSQVELQVDNEVKKLDPTEFFAHLAEQPYRASALTAAMKEVESAYLLRGYYEVASEILDLRFSDDKKQADPLLKISTGPHYEMSFSPPSPGQDLPKDLDTKDLSWDEVEGGSFHVRRPAELASRLRNALYDLGHQLAEVVPDTKIDRERHEALVTLRVTPGPRLILKDLIIKGLDPEEDRTDPEFIRDVFDIQRGDVLGQKQIDRAVSRLYRTGIFSQVSVAPKPEDGSSDPRPSDLEISLDELDARNVDFELGFGSYELLRGGVHYKDRNLFGSGRVLEGILRGSLRSGLLEGVFTDPYSLGLSNQLIARAGAEYRDEPSFQRRSLFANIAVQHELSRHASITGGYRFRFSDVTLEGSELDDEGNSREAGLFVSFRFDDRDSPILPTSGSRASAGVFWSTPGLLADLSFLEFSASTFHYVGLWDSAVLAFGARVTTRQILNDDETLPIQERLFLGGDSSVRSFGEFELGPVDASGEARGGLTSAEVHLELRQRVVDNFHVALFYDGGVINADSFDFAGPYGHAIGLGFRYYLPVGPIRLDFAYNPGERFAADSDFMIHFGFGFTF
ncbi:MAG: BamA/TamA family outer membrane protein [Planctomycetota bacterium]